MTHYFTSIALCFLLSMISCQGQTKKQTMTKNTSSNPLLCDPEKGICEIPDTTAATDNITIAAKTKPVRIIYFTDPICSSCWGIEPQLKKLKLEYGDQFEIEYHMGGLLPSWDIYNIGGIGKPSDVAHHWDEVSRYYDMPIDGDVWLEDPLASSYPPSIAFKAAQIQDKNKALAFMRVLREMVFLEKKNICKWQHIESAALSTNLDVVQLKKDYEGQAKQLFQDDLDLAKKMGVRGFPTLFFSNAINEQSMVYGFKPYNEFESAIIKLYPQATKATIDTSVESLFSHYKTLTTKEFSILANLSTKDAEEALNKYVDQKKLRKTVTKNGTLWILN